MDFRCPTARLSPAGVSRSAGSAPALPTRSMPPRDPAGRMRGSRNRLSEAGISALLRDFSKHGEKAIAKVRRTQPPANLRRRAPVVPCEHKVEQSNPLKAMSDEELDEALAALRQLIADRAAAAAVDGASDTPALPPPDVSSRRMTERDTSGGTKQANKISVL